MNTNQVARLEVLRCIQAFLDGIAGPLGRVNHSAARAALDCAVARIGQLAAVQEMAQVGATSQTKVKTALRNVLRERHLRPIAAIGQSPAAESAHLGRFPMPSKHLRDFDLVAAARAMAHAVEEHPALFVDAQALPADCAFEIRVAAAALEHAIAERDRHRAQLRSATFALAVELTGVRAEVKILDALVTRELRGRRDLFAGWQMAKAAKRPNNSQPRKEATCAQ